MATNRKQQHLWFLLSKPDVGKKRLRAVPMELARKRSHFLDPARKPASKFCRPGMPGADSGLFNER
jgi:hypothetical protein